MTVIHMEGKAGDVFAAFKEYAEANPELTLEELWMLSVRN